MSKLRRHRPENDSDWAYRSAAMVGTPDDENRTIDLVLATDSPIPTYDKAIRGVVDEVLHMDGAELPKQIPLVDSHNVESTRSVIGSIRDLRVERNQLLGRAYFASNPEAEAVYRNYRDGHLTDFSIGARRLEKQYNGATLNVRRFRPVEGSAVVVGADPGAKALTFAQRSYIDPQSLAEEMEQEQMIETLRTEFKIPSDVHDDDVVGWIKRNVTAVETVEPDSEIDEEVDMAERQDQTTVDLEAVKRAERERVAKISDICRRQGLADDETKRFIDGDFEPRDVALELIGRQQESETGKESVGVGPKDNITVGESEFDKFTRAASDALTIRALQAAGKRPSLVLEAAKKGGDDAAIQRAEQLVATASNPAQGYESIRYMSLVDIARETLIRSNQRIDGLPRQEIVKRAMTLRSDGYHTTGSFSNLLLDAANKTLLAAYDEAPMSSARWARQAASVPDFKLVNRIRFGESPNPEQVPELQDYPEGSISDNKESYRVNKNGQIFSISLESVVNDDLDAISRVPAMHGNAMRRKLNKDIYDILIDNPDLSDGVALFHATSHGANLDSTALAEAALDTGFSVMMKQTGLSSDAILNIMPRFLIVPAALSATAYRLVGGGIVPESVSNVPLYGTGGPRPLEVIVDAQLDGDSATAWYLAADPMVVDTIEYTFLQGEETPVLERNEGFVNDSLQYKVRQTWGTAPIDYRGLYQGNT